MADERQQREKQKFMVVMDDDRHLQKAKKVFHKMGLRTEPNGLQHGFSVEDGDVPSIAEEQQDLGKVRYPSAIEQTPELAAVTV